jgi:hypothetical protein
MITNLLGENIERMIPHSMLSFQWGKSLIWQVGISLTAIIGWDGVEEE